MATAKEKAAETIGAYSESPITDEEIQQRAYELYLARGGEDGHDLEDWLEAEQALRTQRTAA